MLFGISAILLHLRWLWRVQSCVAQSELLMLDCAWLICAALRAPCCAEVQAEHGAVLAGLWLGWEPSGSCWPGCVSLAAGCASCQNKSQTRLGRQERCGCFSRGNEEPFYHPGLAWEAKSYPEPFCQVGPAGLWWNLRVPQRELLSMPPQKSCLSFLIHLHLWSCCLKKLTQA